MQTPVVVVATVTAPHGERISVVWRKDQGVLHAGLIPASQLDN